ncbi:MAG: glycosyltransferase family 9 protein, partial [Bacteroidia bacterium]|nr:glycosyltransferase family 9 protein [Bacteroidia bacterium]
MFCNQRVWFSRKQSDLHEAQLNLKLLKPLGIDVKLKREEIADFYGMMPDAGSKTTNQASGIRHPGSRFKLILHPKSKGSAREWGLENFSRLIELLPPDRYEIFITGTAAERELMSDFLNHHQDQVTDMTGKLTLPELMDFIQECDGLVAASTGPLHLAAAFGKVAIGLYAPM